MSVWEGVVVTPSDKAYEKQDKPEEEEEEEEDEEDMDTETKWSPWQQSTGVDVTVFYLLFNLIALETFSISFLVLLLNQIVLKKDYQ